MALWKHVLIEGYAAVRDAACNDAASKDIVALARILRIASCKIIDYIIYGDTAKFQIILSAIERIFIYFSK